MSDPKLPQGRLDRSSPVPAWFQLKRVLAAEIAAGRWAPGDKVPTESELCEHFDVARGTVRQALGELESEGLVERSRGRGTFVARGRSASWLLQSQGGFYEAGAVREGFEVASRVLRAELGPLPDWAAQALGLERGARGVTVERVRSVGGRVALYVVNHLPERIAEAALGGDLERESLYARIERVAGVRVQEGQRSVEAITAGDRLARLLDCRASTPLLFIESVSRGSDGTLIDAYHAWLRTDRVRIQIQVGQVTPTPPPPARETSLTAAQEGGT